MATIKRYQTAGGERWEVRYRQPNGITSRKRGFGTKRDAWVWGVEGRDHQGRGRLCVTSYAYGKHIEPKWAGVPVNKVDILDVKAWAASITRNGSSATVVNRAIGILAAASTTRSSTGHWLSIRPVGSNAARSRRSHRNAMSAVGEAIALTVTDVES
jgi:hypothetical protein